MKLTNRTSSIDFQNVAALNRIFQTDKIIRTRFSIEIPEADMCNAIYAAMLAVTASRGREFVHDTDTRNHIVKAAKWLIDPNKKPGLLLFGGVGNGKTTLARTIVNVIDKLMEIELGYNKFPKIQFVTAKSICDLLSGKKEKDYDKLMTAEYVVIDDLGVEPKELLLYGQPMTPLVDILAKRYDQQLFTIVTTNLGKAALEEKYGIRIYDRMCEWLQPIAFLNKSFRNINQEQ